MKTALILAVLIATGAHAQTSIPLLYCQDLPTEDLEVVEVSWEEQSTEILSRFRDGKTASTRLGGHLTLREGTRLGLASAGTKQRELFLSPAGWVLRVFDQTSSEQLDVFCD